MRLSWKRVIKWAVIGVGVAVAARTAWRFPWGATRVALMEADLGFLVVALAVNLVSMVAKGWGWHLLLNHVAPHRWKTAQEANFIGATVNNLSVSLAGEAARVHFIGRRGGVPIPAAVASVVWARAVEAIGLALFLLVAPAFLNLPTALRYAQIVAAAVLGVVFVVAWLQRGWRLPRWMPRPVRSALVSLAEIGSPRKLIWPCFFAVVNWSAEWATFHLALLATDVHISLAASFMALLATNLGGVLRITPANVGVFQVSMAVGLLPFGVAPEDAVAASLLLQAVQVLPILAIGGSIAGWKGLRQLGADTRRRTEEILPMEGEANRRVASR